MSLMLKADRCTEPAECVFCKTKVVDDVVYGEQYRLLDIVVHYFCVLLSHQALQNGKDEEGIFGFLYDDIKKELDRCKSIICFYCDQGGASVRCGFKKCSIKFHLPCGINNHAASIFKGKFVSYCVLHRPRQIISPQYIRYAEENEPDCPVCFNSVNYKDRLNSLWAACCTKSWYHRDCVARLAAATGSLFKCAICMDSTTFKQEMINLGIYVPERDAAWEYEPNAFEDLLFRYGQCDAVPMCYCPQGRKYDGEGTRWRIILCSTCGSQGIHSRCGNLKHFDDEWECPACVQVAFDLREDQGKKPVGRSPVKHRLRKSSNNAASAPSHTSTNRTSTITCAGTESESPHVDILSISEDDTESIAETSKVQIKQSSKETTKPCTISTPSDDVQTIVVDGIRFKLQIDENGRKRWVDVPSISPKCLPTPPLLGKRTKRRRSSHDSILTDGMDSTNSCKSEDFLSQSSSRSASPVSKKIKIGPKSVMAALQQNNLRKSNSGPEKGDYKNNSSIRKLSRISTKPPEMKKYYLLEGKVYDRIELEKGCMLLKPYDLPITDIPPIPIKVLTDFNEPVHPSPINPDSSIETVELGENTGMNDNEQVKDSSVATTAAKTVVAKKRTRKRRGRKKLPISKPFISDCEEESKPILVNDTIKREKCDGGGILLSKTDGNFEVVVSHLPQSQSWILPPEPNVPTDISPLLACRKTARDNVHSPIQLDPPPLAKPLSKTAPVPSTDEVNSVLQSYKKTPLGRASYLGQSKYTPPSSTVVKTELLSPEISPYSSFTTPAIVIKEELNEASAEELNGAPAEESILHLSDTSTFGQPVRSPSSPIVIEDDLRSSNGNIIQKHPIETITLRDDPKKKKKKKKKLKRHDDDVTILEQILSAPVEGCNDESNKQHPSSSLDATLDCDVVEVTPLIAIDTNSPSIDFGEVKVEEPEMRELYYPEEPMNAPEPIMLAEVVKVEDPDTCQILYAPSPRSTTASNEELVPETDPLDTEALDLTCPRSSLVIKDFYSNVDLTLSPEQDNLNSNSHQEHDEVNPDTSNNELQPRSPPFMVQFATENGTNSIRQLLDDEPTHTSPSKAITVVNIYEVDLD